MKTASTLMGIVVGAATLAFMVSMLFFIEEPPTWLNILIILGIVFAVIGITFVIVATRLWRSNPDTGIIVGVVMGMGALQLSITLGVLLFISNQILQAIE